jgi:hypothetical protein
MSRVLLRANCAILMLLSLPAVAGSFAEPGDLLLRHDLELLNDAGATNLPLTSWPLSWRDISRGLSGIDSSALGAAERAAYERVSAELSRRSDGEADVAYRASLAENPRVIRGFYDQPRDDAEAGAGISWSGERLSLKLQATVAADPFDGDELRPDGSYVALGLGNWLLSAGWQERWWGPGRAGSLILSTNARPAPGVAFQRRQSTPFETKWLSWIGPWSLTAFLNELDDERAVDGARLFGMRVSFKPLDSLEIGLSRTAQWCGEGRPCDFDAFADLLLGNDNRGVNVDPDQEPGNQLAGIDIRWRLPQEVPVALYMQWIGEDTRRGGPELGDWLRLAGLEHWGGTAGLSHRTYIEVADTQCRQGGFGFSDAEPNCGYEHSIYQSGYRYHGRSLGHGIDGDGLAYALGSTLVQPDGHTWSLELRYVEINRSGPPDARNALSPVPQDLADVLVTHERLTELGRFRIGLGYSRLEDELSGGSSDEVEAFIQWSTP